MSSAQRTATIIFLAVLAVFIGRWLFISVTGIARVNDFEVFHHIGEVAATHDPGIYTVMSPVKQRGPFLYPPSAAILFVSLSWMPHDVSGAVFSVVKVAGLITLLWGGVWFSGCRPRDALGISLMMALTVIALFRPINSDVGNGQINIVIALLGVGGVWLIMATPGPRRWGGWWVVGALLIALATAIKLTPALLLAVPLLNRKWKAAALTISFIAALMIALPMFWFGLNHYRPMLKEQQRITAEFTMNWPAVGRQVTLNEVLLLGRAQGKADQLHPDVIAASGDGSPVRGFAPGQFLDADELRQASVVWLGCGLAIGGVFLLYRLSRAGGGDPHRVEGRGWEWDLATMCVFTVLLSPRAQQAHLAILIVPFMWISARVVEWIGRDGVVRHRGMLAGYLTLFALLLANGDWALPWPGQPLRAHPGYFVALLLMLVMLMSLAHRRGEPKAKHSVNTDTGAMNA